MFINNFYIRTSNKNLKQEFFYYETNLDIKTKITKDLR